MRTVPMTPVDAAWYHIDGPVNLAQVTGVLLTKQPLDFERITQLYRARLSRFDRFRQRVVEAGFPIKSPHWQDLPHFDIGQQLHHVALPPPRDKSALMSLLSDLAGTPLDRERPLWDVHVIDEVDGGSALVMRFHHCIGDGTAMMALSQELFDATPDAPIGTEQPRRPHPEAGLLDRLLAPVVNMVDWSARTAATTVNAAMDAASNPGQVLEKATAALDAAGVLVNELLKRDDPQTPLKGDFGLLKRVAWSDPVSLAEVKEIGKLCHAKVNDVLVAGMTGALRHYLLARGTALDHTTLRAMVPVDLRKRERALELGNEFGLVILELAVGDDDPLARLRRTKANMDTLKRSPEAVAVRTLFDIFGRAPKFLEDVAVEMFERKASLVFTNVAGPLQTLYLAGVPVDRFVFWVPHPGKQLGMGISILSYNGSVSIAAITDAHLIPDPEAITDQFHVEFARMLTLARGRATKPLAAT